MQPSNHSSENMILFGVFVFVLSLCSGNENAVAGLKMTEEIWAEFNVTYTSTTRDSLSQTYVFRYNASEKVKTAVRIYSSSDESKQEFPVMFVVRQQRSVMSWQIPLILRNSYEYRDVRRTLCPEFKMGNDTQTEQKIFVEVSTQSMQNVTFNLTVIQIDQFTLPNEKIELVVSPSKPWFSLFQFRQDVSSVLIEATSPDKICTVLSIQHTECPIFDLDTDVEYQGTYQTITTKGAIAVNKEDYSNGEFYVVVVVKPNDSDCNDAPVKIIPAGQSPQREKYISISHRKTLPSSKYYEAVLAAIGFYLAFYVVGFIIGVFYHSCKKNWGIIDVSTFERSMSNERTCDPINAERAVRSYGTTASNSDERSGEFSRSEDDSNSVDSLESHEYDLVKDADEDKNIFRTKTALYVCDMARKSEKRTDKNYKLYCKNLFTISVFYGLPVIQLVMTYQSVLNFTGNQDICYYNFMCANPLGRVSSFNNIFSNCGYVLLGILFIILVARREWLHKLAVARSDGRDKKFGIPQHFGLFYAMGFALVMEGVMSACYHVCPTVSNFQFDTSFMYIIACLCILKIYQNRHPDISAKAHSSYFVMAIVIIIAVIGVVYGTNVFWIIFALVYMTASLVLSIHLYYMGRWQLDRYIFKRLWHLIISDWRTCSRPTYCNRLVLLIIGNVVNWGIALYGASGKSTSDFATFLLAIFIGNLLLYTLFYIFSKLFAREKIPILTRLFILLAAITWGFALKFFIAHLTSWQLTPAGSREGNQSCSLMNFYDDHDIWHFLSAVSLFFSFLVILTLDDELIQMRRDRIPVF